MVDFSSVVGFQWDLGNWRKNVDKLSVSNLEAEQVFFNQPLVVKDDSKHSQQELRWHGLGVSDEGRLLHIVFTLRDNKCKIRIISARDMSKKERIIYEKNSTHS